ncbi:MAG: 1-aminocyclopropane-1-carboxylate deaminase/D-cysteine desulfhydrase [Bacteroidetes bacterium]|nr:1-aminocyclopropane-1-carboxylate deaminase/D-cysteine desulfhydrase [Bacteroidota bacterium]
MLDHPFRTSNSVLEKWSPNCLGSPQGFYIKRDDLIHPIVSGNKWRKLKYAVQDAVDKGCNRMVTYGGAYSNHMVAVACACATLGLKSTCFIRGDELSGNENHYLALAKWYGMQFIPVEREVFRNKKTELFFEHFGEIPESYYVAEGGSGELGQQGVSEVMEELDFAPDYLFHASATATTSAGLTAGIQKDLRFENTKIKSVCVLKNEAEQMEVLKMVNHENTHLVVGYEFGGYAKVNDELMEFVKAFIAETGILIDPVYTGKALFSIKKMYETGEIKKSERVIFLHTGGTLGLFSAKFLNYF